VTITALALHRKRKEKRRERKKREGMRDAGDRVPPLAHADNYLKKGGEGWRGGESGQVFSTGAKRSQEKKRRGDEKGNAVISGGTHGIPARSKPLSRTSDEKEGEGEGGRKRTQLGELANFDFYTTVLHYFRSSR